MNKSKEGRIARALIRKLVLRISQTLSEEERDQFKTTLTGMVVLFDRVSTPEAMTYADSLFKALDDTKKVFASQAAGKPPAQKKKSEPRRKACPKINGHTNGKGEEQYHIVAGHAW